MSLRENHVEKRLVDACKKIGIRCPKGVSENNKGFIDRIVFNTHIKEIHWVEIKNDTYYQQTVLQKEWEEIIKICNGKYFLINGEEEMKAYIKKYIKEDSNEKTF